MLRNLICSIAQSIARNIVGDPCGSGGGSDTLRGFIVLTDGNGNTLTDGNGKTIGVTSS